MKKIIILIVVAMLFVAIIPVAFAVGDKLVIDNANIYSGMTKSYASGYVPIVKDGKVTIVLPLIYQGTEGVDGNTITVKPDLGATTGSPFVFRNYEMNVVQAENTINGTGATISSYLVKFALPLAKGRANGVYPVTINTKFNSGATGEVSQSFKVFVTITDGIDPNATPVPVPTPRPEAPRPQPKIIVSKYDIKQDVVTAGEPFDVLVTLLNTEDHWHTKNIKVTYKGETSDILSNASTNTFFINEIENEETYDIMLKLKTRLGAEPRPQKVLITIEYEDSKRTSYVVNEEIIVEVRQPLRLELDEINIPSNVNAGDSLPISMNVYNMGKSKLCNVLCTLEMKGVIPDGSAFLGNMDSGTNGKAEIYAFFGTLDMTSDGNTGNNENVEKYGMSEGKMTVTYEDEYGEKYTEEVELSTTINRPVFDDIYNQQEEPEEEPEKASQWWISIVLAAGVGMVLYGIVTYRRKINRLRREYGDENI